jgi:hypothetical protein
MSDRYPFLGFWRGKEVYGSPQARVLLEDARWALRFVKECQDKWWLHPDTRARLLRLLNEEE